MSQTVAIVARSPTRQLESPAARNSCPQRDPRESSRAARHVEARALLTSAFVRIASLAVVGLLALLTACLVGDATDPNDDAVAGDGLSDLDKSGTVNGGIRSLTARVCADGETTAGVDVSYYQGNVDWARVRASGVAFAYVRVSDGEAFKDPKFARNWSGTQAAGVIRGAYQFFRPAQDAAAQADILIHAIGAYTPGDLPPVLDVEATGGLSAKTIATRIKTWSDRVTAALGVQPIIYTGKYFWRDQVGGSKAFDAAPLWIAQYTSKCPDLPSPWTRWAIWQSSAKGRVDGISGNVDLDKFNGSLAQLQAFAAGSSPMPSAQPLPFSWVINPDHSYTFSAAADASTADTIEFRVDDYLIGSAAVLDGQVTYTFNVQTDGRAVEARAVDTAGAVVSVGNGLVDTSSTPVIYAEQTGAAEYEIGLQTPRSDVADIEVYADGFPVSDDVSGQTKSMRAAVRHQFSAGGDRELRIVLHDAQGHTLDTQTRTLHVSE